MTGTTKLRRFLLLLIELHFVAQCSSSEHCYHVNGRYVCYFVPFGASKAGEEWEQAWVTCRASGASLPVIENSTMQGLVEKYVKAELPGLEMWTSGRGSRSVTWKWINDRELRDSKLLDNHNYLSPLFDTQAIITTDLKMSARYPSDRYHYACQFKGSICQAKGAISFGNGECLKTVTNESARWYDARNLCLENGGDLPIFESTKLINRTQQVFNQFKDAIGIWIGLRKTWWQWKKTDSTEEAKYTNWFDHDNSVNRECMLLTNNGKQWKQQYCMTPKRFFCQSVKTHLYSAESMKAPTTDANAEFPHKMTIAVGVSIPVIIIAAVASVLLTTKCKSCSSGGNDRPRNRSYAQQSMVHVNGGGPMPAAANGGHHYMDLKPIGGGGGGGGQNAASGGHSLQEQIWVERHAIGT